MPFPNSPQFVKPGEPVASGVVNRAPAVMDARTNYLLALLNTASTGSAIFARQVTVAPSVVPGNAVYFNPATSRYEAALSAATTNVDGVPVTAASAHAWGVIFTKDASNLADILLVGFAALDITAALEPGQTLTAGLYYLSRSTPGALTQVRPPVAMPILRSDGAGNVMVNPAWEDPLTEHVHSCIQLRAAPAGTHTYSGNGPHVITNPDPFVPGWLPADHQVFNGTAPSRAVFGYNISADKQLKSVWPPVPVNFAVLEKDGIQVQDGPVGLVIFDKNGIWWTSNEYGQVPFPDHIHTDPEIISQWSQPSSTMPDNYEYEMQLKLYFTKPTFLTDQTVVTSLQSIDPRVQVICADDGQAFYGPLQIALDLIFMLGGNDTPGFNVFKSFNPATQTFATGPVCSGIYTLSSSLKLYSPLTETVVIDDVEQNVFRGDIGIDIFNNTGRELFTELVRLDGVEEEYVNDVMYLGFDPQELQSFRSVIRVPQTLDTARPAMTLQFRILGLGAGNLPALTLTYLRVPAALSSPVSPVTLPDVADQSLTINTAFTTTAANQYADIQSASFLVEPGDDVFFTLKRSASDVYPYQVGVIRQVGLITSA